MDEYEAWAPGAREKVKTLTDNDLQSMSADVDKAEAVNDLEMLELFSQMGKTELIDPETDKPFTSDQMASLKLDGCNAKMRLAKIKNGNAIPAGSPTLHIASDTLATASADSSGKESTTNPNDEKDFDSCQPALDAQEIEFKAINARNPNTQTIVMGTAIPSVVPGMQVLLYMTEKRMKLLNDYCKGQPQYSQYESIKNSHDVTKEVCLKSTSDPSVCKPVLAW